MPELTDQRTRFEALDGLRGLAAIAITLFHLNILWRGYGSDFVSNTYLFVDFFFVLSGFVICHAYRKRIQTGAEFAAFVIQRLGRLWPLVVFTLAVLVAIEFVRLVLGDLVEDDAGRAAFTGSTAPVAILTNLLMIHALHVHQELTWNAPSWSISTEFYTYLVFGLLVLAGVRLLGAALFLIAVPLAALVVVATNGMDATYDYGMLRCLAGFFTGVVVYLVVSRTGPQRVPANLATVAEIAVSTVALLFVAFAGRTSLSFAAPFVFALVVAVFSRGAGTLSALLRTRPAQFLGKTSYSIYMVHTIVVMLIGIAAGPLGTLLDRQFEFTGVNEHGIAVEIISFGSVWINDVAMAVYLVLVILLASLTFRFVELPGKALFYRLAERVRERASPQGQRVSS